MVRIERVLTGVLIAAAMGVAGCSSQEPAMTAKPAGPSAEGQKFLLASAPGEAQQVMAARADAAAEKEVVVVGRIGGSTKPFVDGMAAFTIVDNSLKACNAIPGDTCPTPWDYCCEADLPKARTLVKLVDAGGKVVTTDARTLLGLSELQTVYVKGVAQRDADGNLSVLASQIYAEPAEAITPPAAGGDHDHGHDHDHDHADEQEHAEKSPPAESAPAAAPTTPAPSGEAT
jgi:hypothetical protein